MNKAQERACSPDKWNVEFTDCGSLFVVAAQWLKHGEWIRHAVVVDTSHGESSPAKELRLAEKTGKQLLLEWYFNKYEKDQKMPCGKKKKKK